ncbi:DUF4124 domain-containing protein [Acinetobacter piscicola]|uniref:DUF4124 domain-containing protein n=1 Tax=Acinetobacter piscicola TaxID=2006115 RepID=UPI000B7EF27F
MKQKHGLTHTVLATLVAATLGMTMTTTHAKQYYKWVDSKGSTHYTTTPPPKNSRSKTKVDTYGWGGNSTPVKTAPVPVQPVATQPAVPQTAPQPVANGQNSAPIVDQQKEANAALQNAQKVSSNAEVAR